MVTLPDGFLTEAIDKDNRSYQYEITITLADTTELVITNEDLIESGGVVIDEAVSNDDALDIGSCIVQKCTITLRNFDGEFDEYDFRNAVVVVRIWLPIPGEVKGFRRGTYIVKELPVYNESTITLTCYDYMTALDVLVSSVNLPTTATPITLMVAAICQVCGVQRVVQNLPLGSTRIVVPNNDTLTCRELMSYIAQMNGMNCRFDADGKLYFTWFGSGYSGYTVRQLQDSSVRSVQGGNIRVVYPLSAEVVWENQVPIDGLYTLDIERYDTVVTGVRIVINTDDGSLDATTYTSGTTDYMISVEENPLITVDNADDVLAALTASLVGFKYRKASFSHIGMPWLMAGDSARIYDAKGIGHNVLISSTVFTSLERQTTVSSGESAAVATPSRFTPATKRYAQQMQYINPIISDINTRIATANGLYETTKVDPVTGATKYFLHNQQDLDDSDIQIVFSDLGIMLTADAGANWYGLEANGTMLASILNTNGINADWIRTGAFEATSGANTIFKLDATNKTMEWDLPYSSLDTNGRLELIDTGVAGQQPSFTVSFDDNGDLYETMIYSDGVISTADQTDSLGTVLKGIFDWSGLELVRRNAADTERYEVSLNPLSFLIYHQIISGGVITVADEVFRINPQQSQVLAHGNEVAEITTPTFTKSGTNITISAQTWSKVGKIVTGDLTLSSSAAISTTTVSLGTLSEHPGHTVIANARTATVQMRASIDSSGVIHINSPSSVAANTTIYLSLSFVAA